MSEPLPNLKQPYSDSWLNTLPPAPSAQRLAASVYGVEPHFLFFASPEHVADPEENYRNHRYSTLYIGSDVIHHSDQFKNSLTLVDSGILWSNPSGLIIINSPRFLFEDKASEGAEGFLSHLLCSLAHRVAITRKAPTVTVNFLETMQLDHAGGYRMNDRHLLVWGPISDHSPSYEINKTIQFLFTFRRHSKILITTTQDMRALLYNLRINPGRVDYYFNFDADPNYAENVELPEATKKKGTAAAAKAPRAYKAPRTKIQKDMSV